MKEDIIEILDQGGAPLLLRRGLQFLYDKIIRSYLPRQEVQYNGVNTYAAKLFDSKIPWHTTDRPRYETALINGVREYVLPGDEVTIVGGGWGVSTVVAASQAGGTGTVTTYEADADMVTHQHDTLELNGGFDNVHIYGKTVGSVSGSWNPTDSSPNFNPPIKPQDLEDCDVLVLDCEGAEYEILEELSHDPGAIIVESHGLFGSPTDQIHDYLISHRYQIISTDVAEADMVDECIENDVRVTVAIHEDSDRLNQ